MSIQQRAIAAAYALVLCACAQRSTPKQSEPLSDDAILALLHEHGTRVVSQTPALTVLQAHSAQATSVLMSSYQEPEVRKKEGAFHIAHTLSELQTEDSIPALATIVEMAMIPVVEPDLDAGGAHSDTGPTDELLAAFRAIDGLAQLAAKGSLPARDAMRQLLKHEEATLRTRTAAGIAQVDSKWARSLEGELPESERWALHAKPLRLEELYDAGRAQ